jgi:hypothetical protein
MPLPPIPTAPPAAVRRRTAPCGRPPAHRHDPVRRQQMSVPVPRKEPVP